MEHIYAVILAGGSGTRFWPKSRHQSPKQLCVIGESEITMIEQTLRRLDGFIPPERRMIVTHTAQAEQTATIVKDHCPHILKEPMARNTAAALAMAALEIKKLAPQNTKPIMISLHADHVIKDVPAFKSCLLQAVDVAKTQNLCLIGISPAYPETGYGYIEQGSPLAQVKGATRVASFREKPHRELAEEYIQSGRFLWNSGLFVWDVDTLLEEFAQYLPETTERLGQLVGPYKSFTQVPWGELEACYGKLPEIAIDHAILEKSKRVAVVDGRFGWQDIGSWAALREAWAPNAQGNLVYGDCYLMDCEDVTADSDGPFVAAIGVKDLVIVAAKGAVLVCPHHKAQDVKHIVTHLKNNKRASLI